MTTSDDEKKKKAAAGDPKKPVRLQIKVDDATARGVFSNLTMVHNNETEFILDFVFVEPQRPVAQVGARVISTPRGAKRLLSSLREMVRRYEERHGEIALPDSRETSGTYH